MGFSAFPDGGRFEALYRTGPGEEESVAVQVRGAKASVGVASFAAGPSTRAGRAQGEGRSRGGRRGRGNRLSVEVSGLLRRGGVAPRAARRPAALWCLGRLAVEPRGAGSRSSSPAPALPARRTPPP